MKNTNQLCRFDASTTRHGAAQGTRAHCADCGGPRPSTGTRLRYRPLVSAAWCLRAATASDPHRDNAQHIPHNTQQRLHAGRAMSSASTIGGGAWTSTSHRTWPLPAVAGARSLAAPHEETSLCTRTASHGAVALDTHTLHGHFAIRTAGVGCKGRGRNQNKNHTT